MNKEWFIFKGTHHLGPYSLAEMEDFFATGEINAQSLVWREGAEKWESLGKTKDLASIIAGHGKKPALPNVTPPKLPSLPNLPDDEDDELQPPTPPKFLHVQPSFDDEPPPIPLDALLEVQGSKKAFKKSVGRVSASKKLPRLIFALSIVLFAIVLVWFSMNEQASKVQIRVKGVMPVYLDKLQEVAAQKTPALALTMALSLDGKTLFASTNKGGDILSIIKLKSIPKRTLGTEDVELMVKGVIKNHLGEFGKMQLTKGEHFAPGEYSIDFNGRKMHFLNRRFSFLSSFSFFKKLNTDYHYQTHALIYSGTPREFEKKINEYKESILNERLRPFTDKLERLQTFSSLLNKTVENYLLVLEKVKNPKDINAFEAMYIKEISPIIQSLVVAANEMAKKQALEIPNESSKVATYSSQVQLGKQIGELASDMITETGRMKKVTEKEKTFLKSKFESRYKFVKSQLNSHILKLQDQIQIMSN